MKSASVLLVFILSLSMQAQQPNKIGDGYGVAALRVVIAVEHHRNATLLLDELEAQISSAAEQKSYDDLRPILLRQVAKLTEAISKETAPDTRDALLKDDIDALPDVYKQLVISAETCYDALKVNLKHRNGAIPKECK